MNEPTIEQKKILENEKKNLIVSASAGSGKTFVVVEYLINLICNKKIPLSKFLVLTFTKAAANEMKTRLYKAILAQEPNEFLLSQLDEIALSDVCTIDAFCEKLIKRNINKLDIDENFIVLDEKVSENLKLLSFNRACEKFSQQNEEEFDEIYFAFKKNKQQIYEVLRDLQSFFESSHEEEKLFEKFLNNSEEYHKKAEEYLLGCIKDNFKKSKKVLEKIEDLPPVYEEFKNSLLTLCEIKTSDFSSVLSSINNFQFPSVPRNKIENQEDKNLLVRERNRLKSVCSSFEDYENLSENLKNSFEDFSLSKAILRLYALYDSQYKKIKKDRSALDFSDLEKKAKLLLEDKVVSQSLQDRYEYIFIDEYQDTNALQESIIKPIAQKGYFMAVGDPKQGIYGFRNASQEIMKKDIEDFSKDEDGDALFLTGNFRSDFRLLDFINKVFEKAMTKNSCGIDYKKTSMLKGLQTFEKGNMPSVCVDIISKEKEKPEKQTGIYSVKEDKIILSKENEDEVKTIASRVEECLKSQIYDAKAKCFREVKEGDIAILFRGRGKIMQECVNFLRDHDFNIVADIKQNLVEDGEVRVLISLMKILCNFDDDISLASVMNSWLGGFSLDELTSLCLNNRDKQLYEIIKESQDEKIVNFKEEIENFYFDSQVLGLTKALNKFLNKKDYFTYLQSLPMPSIKKSHVNELYKIIKSGDFEFNIGGLINYLENVTTHGQMSEQATNAITITTIHATKGLEYPIVILAGGGEKISKVYNKSYIISKEFGLATHLYDMANNLKVPSLSFKATKLLKKRKEFIDELMIFYVALTRAQNNLIIIGSEQEKDFVISNDIFECQTYLDIILNSFGENFAEKLFAEEKIETENWQFRVIDQVIEEKLIDFGNNKKYTTQKVSDKDILKYIDFQYQDKDKCYYEYKNSVSSLLKKEDEIIDFTSEKKSQSRENAIMQGNAYHEALKILDLAKIKTVQDLDKQKEFLKNNLTEGYFEFLNFELLLKNIQIINSVIESQSMIKEREFIMLTSLREAGIAQSDNEVIVQGIVDLFSMGEKNILIDYKFSSSNDENVLRERYKKQIELYSLALKKAFGKEVDEKYLLSLKNAKLIKI